MMLNVEFGTTTCCSCSFIFAVPAIIRTEWQEQHTNHFCPSCGQAQHFSEESEKSRYKRLYDEKLRCCVQLKEENQKLAHRANGYKGAFVKVKRSVQSDT